MDDNSEDKKAKGTKKFVIKRRLMFKNYKDCFFNDKVILQSQQRFKSHYHNIYTEQINKIAQVVMKIRDYKHLIKVQHIRMEQTYSKYAKVRC